MHLPISGDPKFANLTGPWYNSRVEEPFKANSMLVRCPHCQNAIEIVDDAELSNIGCPACGSSFSLLTELDDTLPSCDAPRSIGRFELVEQVGFGAYGSVWKAKDEQLDRWVAIKIPRKELLNSQETEQFLREARAAAQLKHPNIVAVHEVGRQDDTIYIVSDLVAGVALSEYLLSRQFSVVEAAELCKKLTDGLHHAHEHGVIHRDLKPSNIMLDGDQQPHLLDFGLAKRDAAELTVTIDGRVLGTPAYMSPEQASGESHLADRRSDIYSLGVILFEMLTGDRPFRGNTRMLIHQVINDEPPAPRKLNHAIPRDLETICLKCMEKQPARRYPSANQLGQDLDRFLNNKPIMARRIHAFEHGWRWCQRRPLVATLIGLIVLSVAIGISAATVQWRRANSNLLQANEMQTRWKKSADEAQQLVNHFYTRISEETLLDEPGMQPLREKLLTDALNYYQHYTEEFSDRPELESQLARAKFRVALITSQIGSNRDGLKMMLELEKTAQSISFETDVEKSRFLATLANNTAQLYDELGQLEMAEQKHYEALKRFESLPALKSESNSATIAHCHHDIGWLLDRRGKPEEARRHYEVAIQLQNKLLEAEPDSPVIERSLANTMANVALLLRSSGDSQSALDKNSQVIAKLESLARTDADRNLLAGAYSNQGLFQGDVGDADAALDSFRRSVEIRKSVVLANPAVSEYRNRLAMSSINLGMLLLDAGKIEEALDSYEQSIEAYETLMQQNADNIEYEIALGVAHNYYASLVESDDSGHAVEHYQTAIKLLENSVRRAPDHQTARQQMADAYLVFGGFQLRRDNLEEAVETFKKSLAARKPMEPKSAADYYNDACCYCLIDQHIDSVETSEANQRETLLNQAVEQLQHSFDAGFSKFDHLKQDPDFSILKDHPGFIELLADADSRGSGQSK